MSKIIELASSQINGANTISVELVEPDSMPAVVRIVWPTKPSITPPTPKAVAAVAAAMVRCMAEAQAKLATKIRTGR